MEIISDTGNTDNSQNSEVMDLGRGATIAPKLNNSNPNYILNIYTYSHR